MKAAAFGQLIPGLEQWIQVHEKLVWYLGILSVVMFLGTLIVLAAVIVMLPAEHFVRANSRLAGILAESPLLFVCYVVFKNVVGIVFIVAGLAMLVLPGQGLISILVGFSLTSFPGKRRFIRFIIRRKAILHSANWLRDKFDRPPLKSP